MNALVSLPVDGNHCGDCRLARWEENPNGWARVCPLFDMRLSTRHWSGDLGWKQQKMRDTRLLVRCAECVDATDRAEGLRLEFKRQIER
jgi:hypothetical protein